jgi:hypothetical protein
MLNAISKLVSVYNRLLTPLILTFFPREKEPPLPVGEGWGEGVRIRNRFRRK